MIRFFRVTPPSVHQMVLSLEKAGLISRKPGVARSIVVLLDRSDLPELNPRDAQPVKTTVTRYVVDRVLTLGAHPFGYQPQASVISAGLICLIISTGSLPSLLLRKSATA